MESNATQIGSPAFIRQHYLSRSITLYLICILLVGLLVAGFGTEKFLELTEKSEVVQRSEELMGALERDKQKEEATHTSIKTEYKDRDASLDTELANVFPSAENYTDLTKTLDDYFAKKNKVSPMVATDIQYGAPTTDKSSKYDILPISMSITASEPNFYDFLRFIQNSGTLSTKLRLMDLKSIQLNFSEENDADSKKTIQFRAEINAYFQKSK
mgnify:CR=1 FL=1